MDLHLEDCLDLQRELTMAHCWGCQMDHRMEQSWVQMKELLKEQHWEKHWEQHWAERKDPMMDQRMDQRKDQKMEHH